MVTFYADTSVLLKRHVAELGSQWFDEIVESSVSIATTELSVVEVYSAFNRLVREGRLVEREYRELLIDFEELLSIRYTVVPLSKDIMRLACRVLERHPLRAYDSLHLATAIYANNALVAENQAPPTFLSADHRLLNAAAAEGLVIFDPSTVP